MKVRIEIIEDAENEEIVIRCAGINERIQLIERTVAGLLSKTPALTLYKDGEEFYISPKKILFFETQSETVCAHTADDAYKTKQRLYELENILPREFIRISKSAIINVRHIMSISRNLSASSLIKFHGSHKQVYVSRSYFKAMRQRLDEIRAGSAIR